MKRDRGVAGAFLFCVVLLAAVAPAAADGGPVRLLKDVNPVPSWDRGSFPEHFRRFGSLTLFTAFTPSTGFELWRTDGTEAGTRLVKDIWRGPNSALSWNMAFGDPFGVELNGRFLFLADDGVHGFELWATDGTEAGTVMLKDIRAAGASPFTSFIAYDPRALNWSSATANGKLYFVADDGIHGFELWATDGTGAGTVLVKDIRPGAAGTFGPYFYLALQGAAIGPILYFQAATDEYGAELWRTDGTEAGTFMVRDLEPGSDGSYPSQFTELHGGLVFSASTSLTGSELWASDGTTLGTALVGDLFPGTFGSNPSGLTRVGDLVYFHSYEQLYRTDGTPAGTVRLRSFSTLFFDFYGELNGRALFRADDIVHGFELWVSDGTAIGTELLKDITPSGAYGYSTPVHVPGAVYFWANDGVHGMEPWRSDGTAEGTQLLADLTAGPSGSQVFSLIPWRGGVIFSTLDGLYTHFPGEEVRHILPGPPYTFELFDAETQVLFSRDESDTGVELWRTDGTEASTRLLKELNPVPRTGDSYPGFLGNATRPDGRVVALFDAYDGESPGLWASDGTSRETHRLASITVFNNSLDNATVGGIVYFLARDSEHGDELWRSDGTEAGTRLVVDLLPGEWGAVVSFPIAYRGKIYFMAEVDESGRHLWVSDGTPNGTVPLGADTPPEFFIQKSIVAGKLLYFQAYHPSYGNELWRTDGTAAGTRIVKDIGPPHVSGCCLAWFPLDDNLLIIANDGVHGYEPWITDGSEEGTTLLKDIYPGSGSSFIVDPQPGGPYVHFAASHPEYGRELWRTDGTEAGTVLVKDIIPGPVSSYPNLLGDAGGRLLFVTNDATRTFSDLWTSDGSEAGTVLLRAGFPGDPRAAAAFDGVMLFSNPDDEHGLELWRSDGTAAGTTLVQDLTQGPDSSFPDHFFRSGTSLFMMADDPVAAQEPFVGRTAIVLGQPLQAVSDLKADVDAIGLPRGIARSLEAKLDAAAAAITARRTGAAVAILEAFARSVEARTHQIGEESAADLIQFAGDLRALLAVEPPGTPPIGGGREVSFEGP